MEIWIENKIGFLQGYSETEQPHHVVVEMGSIEDFDFKNWRYDGNNLIHDSLNAPIIEEIPSEIDILRQENKELNQRQDMTDAAMLELADVIFGGGE